MYLNAFAKLKYFEKQGVYWTIYKTEYVALSNKNFVYIISYKIEQSQKFTTLTNAPLLTISYISGTDWIFNLE